MSRSRRATRVLVVLGTLSAGASARPRSAAAGTAFEKLTGKTIYQALEDDLARPLGMQDFDRSKQGKVPSPGSVHPEYVMRLSTRDLARVGQLMLRNGRWNGTPLLPAEWVRYSTSLTTPFARVARPLLSAS